MATGKSRNKRAGASAVTSTAKILIFLAVCGLAIWLLTSNPLKLANRTETGAGSMREAYPVHEDVTEEHQSEVAKRLDAADTVTDKEDASSENEEKHENQPEEVKDSDIAAVEKVDQRNGDDQSVQEHEEQMEIETQTSEESSVTQEQVIEENQDSNNQKIHEEEAEVATDGTKILEKGTKTAETDNLISDEDQQKRIETQQKKEDEQIRDGRDESTDLHGATIGENTDTQNKEESILSADPQETTQDAINKDVNLAETQTTNSVSNEEVSLPNGESSEIPKESTESKKSWATQAHESENENERRIAGSQGSDANNSPFSWQLCNETAGADFIPCLDNEKEIAKLHGRQHYEHRERHCPENPPSCLVPLPPGYKKPVHWPKSRNQIWYSNVPHTLLAEVKGHQNWVKVSGEYLTFPGGGTQFIHGALHYIDFIQQAVPDIAWGKHTRVVLDVGCGVASFGGYLFDRDVIAMSFAPKDEHEAQVQFALERGIPAISSVMGSRRLPFPSRVFDVVHCARCRVPWHADGGKLLLELNRVLRPGGYFVWSATPVYQKLKEDVEIWKEMSKLTVAMCWELVTIKKDKLNSIGAAIYQKPDSNNCYNKRKQKLPPICNEDDDPDAAWYVPLEACMHKVPTQENQRGSQWPEEWPERLKTAPSWLDKSQNGIYGKPAPDDFVSDYKHWKNVISKTYMNGLGINWNNVRNVMDMRAVYGGFAAALKDRKLWVMNVVNVDSPDTLPIIYERGLFGIYHDWCESFSTYPRTYDLLHADRLFCKLKKRCNVAAVMAEVDRVVRPGGILIVRDESGTINEVEEILKSLHWDVLSSSSKNQEGLMSAQKSEWRPSTYTALSSSLK